MEYMPAQEEASQSSLPALHSGGRSPWMEVSLKNISNGERTLQTEALLTMGPSD